MPIEHGFHGLDGLTRIDTDGGVCASWSCSCRRVMSSVCISVESFVVAQSDDPGIRRRAVRALGRIGDIRAREPLTEMIADGNDSVRREVGKALRKLEK